MRTTSSRDNWVRLVEAVIKKEQVWQLCHQDSITTVGSDFTQPDLSLRPVPSSSSRLPLTKDSVVHEYPFGLESFSLRELQVATDNFKYKNKIGDGGFGKVYKGRLADGSLVAVKIYEEQAQVKIEEELEILSIVKHRNVVCPLGVCVTEKNRLLVYPYMANGSVASCLRASASRASQPALKWETRLRIALGVARGLDYLHHGCTRGIIHRDVKATNILLDEDFEAVFSDLSLAIFTDSIDHVMRGTIGHIAPEYLSTGKCSWKTDVYGYGMFLLELITAQQGINLARLAKNDDMMLLDWVNKLFEEKKFEIIVARHLDGNFVEEEVEKLFQIVLICTKTDPQRRPTMSEIVRMLEHGGRLDEVWKKFSNNYSLKHRFRRTVWTKMNGKMLQLQRNLAVKGKSRPQHSIMF